MAQVQIRYQQKTFFVAPPMSLKELTATVREVLGVKNPQYQYCDEDNELITVDVDLELVEAIRFIMENNSYFIVEDKTLTGSSYQFIDDLPLLRSQITSEEPANELEESLVLETFEYEQGGIKRVEKVESVNSDVEEKEIDIEELKLSEKEEFISPNVHLKIQKTMENKTPIEESKNPIKQIEEPKNLIKKIEEPKNLIKNIEKPKNPITQIEESKNNMKKIEYPEIKLIREEPRLQLEEIREIIQDELKKSFIDPKIIHNVRCANCKNEPIRGVVYKCKNCIGFYLCEPCEESTQHPHLLLKIKKPLKPDPLESLLSKICEKLQFKDKEKVIKAILANNYNYDKTVESLLAENN